MSRILAVIRKEFIQIKRDVRALVVVLALPVVMLALYGYAINMDVNHLRTAVVDQDHSSAARELMRAFAHNEYFDIVRYFDSPAQIDEAIERGDVRVAVTIPRGYARDLASGRKAQVQVIVDGADARAGTAAVTYISGVVSGHSAEVTLEAAAKRGMTRSDLLQPIDVRPRVWYNPELKSSNFTVPGLIAVILMMLSALLTSMTVVRERERGTIEQLVVSPVMPHELMIGKIVPYAIIAFLDIVVVSILGRLVFGVPMRGDVLLLLVLSAVFVVAALGIGLLISSVSDSQQEAMTIAMMATMLPTIIFSGFVFPIASMPAPIQAITYLLPARYYLVILRGIFLKGVGPAVLWPQAVPLLLFGAAAIALSAARFKKQL